MIDIALFDEHRLVLEGISGLLSGMSDFRVVLNCDDRNVLTEKLKSMQIHVLILNMHDISVRNLNLIVQLNISNPKLKILVISVIDSEEIVLKTIKAGAKGFLGKDSDRNSLLEAVYTLRNGHDYYSKSITHLLLNRYISSLKADELNQNADIANLSSRQVEILKLWGESYSNQEIADRFFISVRTVESHKNHIMQKLNLKSTVDMVKFAIKNNIIEIQKEPKVYGFMHNFGHSELQFTPNFFPYVKHVNAACFGCDISFGYYFQASKDEWSFTQSLKNKGKS